MMWLAIFVISAIGGLAAMHSHSEQRQQHLEQTVHRLVVTHHQPAPIHRHLRAPSTLDGAEVANLEEQRS